MNKSRILKTTSLHVRGWRAPSLSLRACTSTACLLRIFLLGFVPIAASVAPLLAQDDEATRELNEGYEAKESGDLPTAADAFRRAMDADPSSLQATLELGYTLLELELEAEATPVFEHAVELSPDRGDLWAQLGYLYLEADRQDEALEAFLQVERLAPERYKDRLQLAFILDERGDRWAARKRFEDVATAPGVNRELRERAEEALQVYAAEGVLTTGTRSVELYSNPYYMSRFSNLILPGQAHAAISMAPRIGLDLYTVSRAVMDTRTEGGDQPDQPQIFSDNMIGQGIGLRIRPFGPWATIYGELGFAEPLRTRPDPLRKEDNRAGVILADDWTVRGRPGDVFLDASAYSRYENGIAYASFTQLINVPLEDRKRGWDYYGRVRASADTDGEFFNNILEVGPGVRYLTGLPLHLTVYGELVGGWYTRGRPDGSDTYGDLRFGLLLYGQHFWLARDEY